MERTFRGSDLLFRYGGEEFVALLFPITARKAMQVFERFRQRVESFEFVRVGQVTVSTGVVCVTHDDFPSNVVLQADRALNYAKNHGHNQVSS